MIRRVISEPLDTLQKLTICYTLPPNHLKYLNPIGPGLFEPTADPGEGVGHPLLAPLFETPKGQF